ncbi:MAG: hypothetical protein LJE61_00220 [Thiocapsa sp.]|jgi:hypothetical protein|nr:hypothetical protein [Thiocapsa sp.]MCG6898197.1 hypothetical protein [Thiocapsa sp.]MCG6983614.1 hypothetical protein [Thiocapsa sp.]
MYIDNLTIAGATVTALYLLMPLLFGREMLRVELDAPLPDTPDRASSPCTRPCLEA